MKINNLVVISVLIIIALLSLFIGTVTPKFGFHKSVTSNSITSKWNNSKSIDRYKGSNEEVSFPKIPIIVVYKSKKVGDVNSLNPLKIDISDKDFGSLRFPWVIWSYYEFSVTCKNVHEIKTDSVIGKFVVDGEINVSGQYKLMGSYSTETATNMIVDKVLNDMYNEVRKNIK